MRKLWPRFTSNFSYLFGLCATEAFNLAGLQGVQIISFVWRKWAELMLHYLPYLMWAHFSHTTISSQVIWRCIVECFHVHQWVPGIPSVNYHQNCLCVIIHASGLCLCARKDIQGTFWWRFWVEISNSKYYSVITAPYSRWSLGDIIQALFRQWTVTNAELVSGLIVLPTFVSKEQKTLTYKRLGEIR